MELNAATRLTAAPHDEHLQKILNAINHSGIKSSGIDSDGQEIVVLTQKAFNVHALEKFAHEMRVDLQHITIQPGHGAVELRIPSFVIGK